MNYPLFDWSAQTASAIPFAFELPEKAESSHFLPTSHKRAVLVSDQSSTIVREIAKNKSTGESLFDATAEAKRWTSQIAMRLDPEARRRFFRQLDWLHDENEWFEGDLPITLDSYKSFVRAYLSGNVGGKPALALGQAGRLIAIWQEEANKITIEFFPRDKVRYVVSQVVNGEHERFAGDTSIGRLTQVLSPFRNARWFNGS